MTFKIGQFVKYDGTGVPVMARVEGYVGTRVRIAVLPDGLHLTVPAGDLSLPGEDEAARQRAISRDSWRNAGNLQVTNQVGGSYTKAASGSSGEEGHIEY